MKGPFSVDSSSNFSLSTIQKVNHFQSTHESYKKTPLVRLANLANYLGVEDIFVKDESHRFGLNAFKVLGGIYAIGRYLAEKLRRDIETLSFDELKSPEVRAILDEITFITATDGNHGRGIAWAARAFGYKAIVYMPKGSSIHRLEAIRREGAEAEITDYNYDDTVRMAADRAKENGWVLIQDTAWQGYEDIPLWIMQGYATLAKETIEQMEEYTNKPPTHLFLQAGVGSFASAIAAYFAQYYREHHPKIIVVEPQKADCFYQSFAAADHSPRTVNGEMNTIMAGLACGEPSSIAWEILKHLCEASFSCDDAVSALGMRVLGNPLKNDERVVSGESGAVTAGLLYCLAKVDDLKNCKEQIGLDENSSIVLISTEGDTDEENYRKVVWEGAYPSL